MLSGVKKFTHEALRRVGYDISRVVEPQRAKFLGLRRRPIRTIIDVGANVGQFAREASAVFPMADLHCYEPQPNAFAELEKWVAKTNGRVRAYNVALGEKSGTVPMLIHTDFSPSSSFLKTTETSHRLFPETERQKSVLVEVKTLDDAMNSVQLQSEILIKLDVQGYERFVINGGSRTFKKACACILEVCIDPLYEQQSTFKQIFMLMDELDFEYAGNLEQSVADDGHPIFLDAVFTNKAR